MSKISVIVPIYNSEEYLDRCLRSIRAQTLSDIEILCIDDGSTDASRAIVDAHAREDDRIVLVSHPENVGHGGARNTGLRTAQSEYISFVDSDDYAEPEMLKILWEATEENKYDLVVCGFNRVNESGEYISTKSYSPRCIENTGKNVHIFRVANPACWNKLLRRSIFFENNLFFPENTYYEDLAITPMYVLKSKNIKFISDALYNYTFRDNSVTRSYSAKHIIDYFKVFEAHLDFLKRNSVFGRYRKAFYKNIGTALRFHSRNVAKLEIDEVEKDRYLRHMLLLKIAFINNFGNVETLSREELLALIDTAQNMNDVNRGIVPDPDSDSDGDQD